MNKLKVLLTNDDGYKCIGLSSLSNQLKKDYIVTAIAPEEGKSWVGKAITPKSMQLKKNLVEGKEILSIKGSPADCVQIGIYNLESKPDLVISGINIGANAGLGWILSSGTVGTAIESALQKIPAIAISYRFPLKERKGKDFNDQKNIFLYKPAAQTAKKVVDKLVSSNLYKKADFFIVNIPFKVKSDVKIEITKVANKSYQQLFYQNNNHLAFKTKLPNYLETKKGTDLDAIAKNRISITPIKLGLNTPKELSEELKRKIED